MIRPAEVLTVEMFRGDKDVLVILLVIKCKLFIIKFFFFSA